MAPWPHQPSACYLEPSLQYLPLGDTAVLTFLAPVLVAAGAPLVLGERAGKGVALAMPLCVAGKTAQQSLGSSLLGMGGWWAAQQAFLSARRAPPLVARLCVPTPKPVPCCHLQAWCWWRSPCFCSEQEHRR